MNIIRERERGPYPAKPLISSQAGNWSDGDRLNGLSPLKQRRKNDLPRYNRLLSSRLSSRVGCAWLSCIALRRRYVHWLGGGSDDAGKSVENAWRSEGKKETRGGGRKGIIYYAVSMSLTMTASSILVTRRLSWRPISADHR